MNGVAGIKGRKVKSLLADFARVFNRIENADRCYDNMAVWMLS